MTYRGVSKSEFFEFKPFNEVIGCWTRASEFPEEIYDEIFLDQKGLAAKYDYYTPLAKGKEWLFELTCRYQPRTGELLMGGGALFVRANNGDPKFEGVPIDLTLGLEVQGKIVVVGRRFWGNNPSDETYDASIKRITEVLTERWGRHREPTQRHLSLPVPIREAYYTRFDGMSIPDSPQVGIYPRFLPAGIGSPWQSWDGYLGSFRGYKKKYLPWLEERIPGVRHPQRDMPWTYFMMFLDTRWERPDKGDVFFVKNHVQDGVIYHIKDADIENMRILSEPAEAIDRYCEHVLMEREGSFDFLPYTNPM